MRLTQKTPFAEGLRIIRVVAGLHGAREKWTLVDPVVPTAPGVFVVGASLDPVWAIVASR